MKNKIPVIDLFAGPGGLGEGISSYKGKFKIGLSVEKEASAHRTLRLRAFYRQFPQGKAPDIYYQVLRGELTDLELFACKNEQSTQIKKALINAEEEALCATLGEIPEAELDKRISGALNGHQDWLLIGGPPCQAYSMAGRSRNLSKKEYVPEEDTRHYLYKEYLRVIAKHQPAVFIMENVKGLLSSKVNGKLVFIQMLKDLKNPTAVSGLKHTKRQHRYKILSLSDNTPR